MHKLLFGNPVFDLPVMTTCRSGEKWYDALNQHDRFEICDVNGNPIGKVGCVIGLDIVAWDELDDAMVADNHDPSCRTLAGLEAGMDAAYPGGWDRDTLTLITFSLEDA